MKPKKETYIHAKCNKSEKSEWINAAKSEKLKLTEWVVKTLNQATKTYDQPNARTNPAG